MSPIWRTTIEEYIDDNCYLFQDTEENTLEMLNVHKKYMKLIENTLEKYLTETGISFEDFSSAIILGVQDEAYKWQFEKILFADNFDCFKRMMVSRNKHLELECLKLLGNTNTDKNKKYENHISNLESEKEKHDLEYAIELSKNIYNERLKAIEEEEKILLEVIEKSKQTAKNEEEKKEKENLKIEKITNLKTYNEKENSKIAELKSKIESLNLKNNEEKDDNTKVNTTGIARTESLDDRKKRLIEQRNKLLESNKEKNKAEMKSYVLPNINNSEDKPDSNTKNYKSDNLSKVKDLYNKFKNN